MPLPAWLVPIIREHLDRFPVPANAPVYANAVGKPLRRTLFRSRVWKPTLERSGLPLTLRLLTSATRTPPGSWTTECR
ncbi:MAG TPA: hypothetical protein VHH34_22085 [Pseudonocardiaceae bacterium]|nr:hypothetical protein [Pseudonocardiaceae bacterium]